MEKAFIKSAKRGAQSHKIAVMNSEARACRLNLTVHALIESENAPALEYKLHKQLLALQVNKINSRKEFFRMSMMDIHQEIEKLNPGEDFTVKIWTEKAVATEYRDSLDIENDPQKKRKLD